MATREDLTVHLTAQDNSAAAFNSFNRNLKSAGSGISALGALAATGLGALGVGLSAGGLAAFAKEAVSSLGKIADEADRVGTSTEALQALRYEIKLGGGEAGDAAQALTRFADAASEAGLGGNYLAKVFQANGIALRDQNGNLRSSDALLQDYATLVANAATQQDKLMLATEAFGRRAGPKMVSTLEKIAKEGLPGLIAAGKEAGQVVEDEIVRAADAIDDKWNTILDSMTNRFKRFVVAVVEGAGKLPNINWGQVSTAASDREAMEAALELQREGLRGGRSSGLEGALELDREGRRARGYGALPKPAFNTTKLPSKGSDDPDRNRTAEILENLRLEGDQLTLNLKKKREAERLQMQINMVQRAGVDATIEEKEQIKGAVDALFQKRLAYEESKRAQDALNDALRFGGELLTDSIQGLINKTKDWRDVMKDVLNSLTQALLKAAIMGEGPMAGMMGMKSASGGVGGLLGALFGGARAQGGPVQAGKAYLVNENTPNSEIFMPGVDGSIIPPGKVSGRGDTVVIHYSPQFNDVTPAMIAQIESRLQQERRVMPGIVMKEMQRRRGSDPSVFGPA